MELKPKEQLFLEQVIKQGETEVLLTDQEIQNIVTFVVTSSGRILQSLKLEKPDISDTPKEKYDVKTAVYEYVESNLSRAWGYDRWSYRRDDQEVVTEVVHVILEALEEDSHSIQTLARMFEFLNDFHEDLGGTLNGVPDQSWENPLFYKLRKKLIERLINEIDKKEVDVSSDAFISLHLRSRGRHPNTYYFFPSRRVRLDLEKEMQELEKTIGSRHQK